MSEVTWGEIAGLLIVILPFVILLLPQLMKKKQPPD
jgi:hypothetical protein